MPIYLFWGEDEFALQRAQQALRDRALDPDWASFNYDKLTGDQPANVIQALNQAMTPPFGSGGRLVWLAETTLCQRCPEELLAELERSLPVVPDSTTLLLTMTAKPDGRIKSTKLLQKYASIQEFSLIPPWKTEAIAQQVQQAAQAVGVQLSSKAVQLLAESVGSNTRQLYTELEKLRLYTSPDRPVIDERAVASLVTATTQNSLKLADAIRTGQTAQAIALVNDLFARNEPALRIVATLVGKFRTWLWVKLMLESGERDEGAIARAAEIANPKRIYFFQQEVRSIPLQCFQQTLPLLLELEVGLKQGADELLLMQSQVIGLCWLYRRP